MNPYRMPAHRDELELVVPAPGDGEALVSFAAAIAVVVLSMLVVGLIFGPEIGGLVASLLVAFFLKVTLDDLEP